MTVDKNSNLPMHQQLYLILKEKIEKGEYKEHSQIPSESEIQSIKSAGLRCGGQFLIWSAMAL